MHLFQKQVDVELERDHEGACPGHGGGAPCRQHGDVGHGIYHERFGVGYNFYGKAVHCQSLRVYVRSVV